MGEVPQDLMIGFNLPIDNTTLDFNYTDTLSSDKLSNTSSSESDLTKERLQDSIYLTLYSATCIAALFGNSIVCKVVFCKSHMRTFTNLLLANMAISDILCALMFPLGLLVCWDNTMLQTGHYMCIVAKVIQLLSFQVSSITMMVVAVDRFLLVHYPILRAHRVVPVIALMVAVWIIAFGVIVGTSPQLAFHRYFTPEMSYIKCEIAVVFTFTVLSPTAKRIGLIIANLAHFWIPLFVILVCYASISWKVLNRNVGNMTVTQQDTLIRAKWKTIKMLIAAVSVFFLCWFPFFILNMMDYFIGNLKRERPCNKSGAFFLTIWIAFTSCCWSPFVYWIYSEDFREGLRVFGDFACFKYISKNGDDGKDGESSGRRTRTRTMSSRIVDA
ncbi:putative G-protein coupled receptor 83 [Orchesella cincta]|uniref:Putative G-protein coupled receptor 83 n=1 Tax=Orchesella cincta TaxID=48709 RepID=A0A1D2N053_ORCCI|nr:putative G-protein coupled receptor 83 [Orchesella cincta]